jgi:hypothetical protein
LGIPPCPSTQTIILQYPGNFNESIITAAPELFLSACVLAQNPRKRLLNMGLTKPRPYSNILLYLRDIFLCRCGSGVEQLTRNEQVMGSIPITGSKVSILLTLFMLFFQMIHLMIFSKNLFIFQTGTAD